jgi:hypothetical protein
LSATRKLLFGETWVLPAGVALLLLLSEFVLKPALGHRWADWGWLVFLAYALGLLVVALNRDRRRPVARGK